MATIASALGLIARLVVAKPPGITLASWRAFPDARLVDASELGSLAASLVAGSIGWLLLRSGRRTRLVEA